MTILSPMTETEFEQYMQKSIPQYASEKVKSGQWSEQEALQKSHKDFHDILPFGLQTKNNFLFTLTSKPEQESVGMLWYAIEQNSDIKSAFVYDISIRQEHQHKGHATRAFTSLEKMVKAQGLSGIGLHVFGFNTAAYGLYKKLGYKTTNIRMFKSFE